MKRQRIRQRLIYKPKQQREQFYYSAPWHGLYENWSKKWVNKNYWRVATTIGTKEDAVQQCAEVFFRCRNKYGLAPIEPSHFMALYKVAVMREWGRLSLKDASVREHIKLAEIEPSGVDYNAGALSAAYATASWELKHVMEIIVEAPAEVLKVMFAMASMKDLNTRVLAMCGLGKSRRNVIKELKRICAPDSSSA